jgi:lipoprotein-anchoring transpeptidase ErfK/SrfK
MMEKETLRGADYETPVNFWMPFYGGCGFHSAEWRWAFGGNIYTYDGSHGCVNCPYDFAKILYENSYIGMTVIVT